MCIVDSRWPQILYHSTSDRWSYFFFSWIYVGLCDMLHQLNSSGSDSLGFKVKWKQGFSASVKLINSWNPVTWLWGIPGSTVERGPLERNWGLWPTDIGDLLLPYNHFGNGSSSLNRIMLAYTLGSRDECLAKPLLNSWPTKSWAK